LFEQATSLGGRAGSLVDSVTGQRIDYCQHVGMGCCTDFLDFCRQTAIDDCFQRVAGFRLIGPDAKSYDFRPSRWLPAPLHLLPSLMQLRYLTFADRCRILRALRRLRSPINVEETAEAWLRGQNQSQASIERFWSMVLVSALAETVGHVSLSAARQVVCEGFLASRGSSDLLLPRFPLGAIFDDRLRPWLTERDVKLHLRTPVRQIEGDRHRVHAIQLADGTRRSFDGIIVAAAWRRAIRLFPADLQAAIPTLTDVERIPSAGITAVHLWFDRCVIPLGHAALVGRLGQWVFAAPSGRQQYCQVVISASHRLPKRSHDDWVRQVCQELAAIWPAVDEGRLVHGRVITQPVAVLSPQPGVDSFRPPQQTSIPNLALAGDWTATDWPGTMEGAIRSGFRAVEALNNGRPASVHESS
jgi:squalene-associated FAD-dependent desaturase